MHANELYLVANETGETVLMFQVILACTYPRDSNASCVVQQVNDASGKQWSDRLAKLARKVQ